MKPLRLIVIVALAELGVSCAQATPSNDCEGMSRSKAIELARADKRRMLSRSLPSEQKIYAGDIMAPAEGHGYAGVIGFRGTDGTTLVALIDDDCYVSWSQQ
jgi:hypothetical protein